MIENTEKYPNFPPYDAQIKFYEGSTLKVISDNFFPNSNTKKSSCTVNHINAFIVCRAKIDQQI